MSKEQSIPSRVSLGGFAARVIVTIGLVALALLLWEWRHVLLLAFASILIAVGLHGIADPIASRTPVSRSLALAGAALLVIAVLGGVGWLFGSQVHSQIDQALSRMPQAWSALREQLASVPGGPMLVQEVEGWMDGSSGSGMLGPAFARVGSFTLTAADVAMNTLVVVIAAVFLAISPRPYRQGLLKLAPTDARDSLSDALSESERALKRWLGGTLISMLVMIVVVSVALMLLGVPAFFALGLIAGLGQFVPLIGPIVAAVPGVLLALTVDPMTALWTGLIYFAASQLEANLLYPIIQRKAVSLPGALTLFSIIAMGALFGSLGILLAVPIVVVATILIKRFYIEGALHDQAEPVA